MPEYNVVTEDGQEATLTTSCEIDGMWYATDNEDGVICVREMLVDEELSKVWVPQEQHHAALEFVKTLVDIHNTSLAKERGGSDD